MVRLRAARLNIADWLALILFVGMVGCVALTPPETPRERYAAAEVSYKAVVTTIGQLADAGTLQKGSATAKRTATGLRAARHALDAWGAAPDSRSLQAVALAALTALQGILTDINKRAPP